MSVDQTTGIVRALNPVRGMVAIWVESQGGHTIIEMLSGDPIEIGDNMAWDDGYDMGTCRYRNVTKGWAKDVFVQNHDVTASSLKHQLLG